MEVNGRIEKAILKYILNQNYGSMPSHVLPAVRVTTKVSATQQAVSKRMYYLYNLGLLRIIGKSRGSDLFVIPLEIKPIIRSCFDNKNPIDIDVINIALGRKVSDSGDDDA